jgi:hypothetical protein
MYEPITVVKVREARTVTIPAGGWMILGNPDQPLSQQIEARNKLVRSGNVNDEFSALLIGRLQNTHPNTRFVTRKEAEAAAAQTVAHNASIEKNISDARAREKQMAEDAQKKRDAEHAARIKEVNKLNDSIRTRAGTVPDPVPEQQSELKTEAPAE